MARRVALLIGNGQFPAQSRLSTLRGPVNDVQYFGEVLAAPEYGGFEITRFIDTESYVLQHSIERLLNDLERDDLVLVYYSGHGTLDSKGNLCLATSNTHLETLRSTSLSVTFLKALFDDCRSNRVVLILDCCFSGAAGRSFTKSSVEDQLALAQGSGIHILTSSTGIETSAEREQDSGGQVAGVFTRCLADGILSGDADIDQDAAITVDDLRRYVGRQVRGQSPKYWGLHTSHDVVISRNPRIQPRARTESPPERAEKPGERAFSLPIAILSVAALSSEVVRVIMDAAEGSGSARWSPAITAALVALVPYARSGERRYRSLLTTGLALLAFGAFVSALFSILFTPYAPSPLLWAPTILEAAAFIAFATAFATRGGAYPTPLLIPYGLFAVAVLFDLFEYNLSTYGRVRGAIVVVAACTAAQAWYRNGSPGASWAAFGGVLWLAFEFAHLASGTTADSGFLMLPVAGTWLVAMSVRNTVTTGVRSHPDASRWVLAGSLCFLVWFLAARLNISVRTLMGIQVLSPIGAAATGAVVWTILGTLIVVIFEGRSRGWQWKLFLGSGLLATVACWLMVANKTGQEETFIDAGFACSLWPLPLLVPFVREAVAPISQLDRQANRTVWLTAIVASAWSVLLIADEALGAQGYWLLLVLALLGTIAVALCAHSVYRYRRLSTSPQTVL